MQAHRHHPDKAERPNLGFVAGYCHVGRGHRGRALLCGCDGCRQVPLQPTVQRSYPHFLLVAKQGSHAAGNAHMIAIMQSEIASLFRSAPVRHWGAGQPLFRVGDRPMVLHLVVSGRVALARVLTDGTELTLQSAVSGNVLAEASAYTPTYHCDARAMVASATRAVDPATLRATVDRQRDCGGLGCRSCPRRPAALAHRSPIPAHGARKAGGLAVRRPCMAAVRSAARHRRRNRRDARGTLPRTCPPQAGSVRRVGLCRVRATRNVQNATHDRERTT